MIPYGRQSIDEDDIQAVVDVLRSDWLTTGPKVGEFEEAFAEFVGAKHAVAVSNGTAALHCAMYAADIGPGDEVIVTPMTFAASVNCVLYQRGTPVFVDVDADTGLIDPAQVRQQITERSKAIVAVDYAGQPCDYDELQAIADEYNLILIADACHSLGAAYKGRKVGTLADMSVFSFHPVKHMTTGEGGMITTDNAQLAEKLRLFRNHGITTDHRERAERGSWFYEMVDLGFNYRITDIQCALGLSQLKKLPAWLARRREVAAAYHKVFKDLDGIRPLICSEDVDHAYHLFVVRIEESKCGVDRATAFDHLRSQGIGVNVHYIPVHLHPYYREQLKCDKGALPMAEHLSGEIISLPMHQGLSAADQESVIDALRHCVTSLEG